MPRQSAVASLPGAGRAPRADPFDAGPFPWVEQAFRRLAADTPHLARRAFFVTMAAWLPLLVLAEWEGLAWRINAREAFLLDLSAQARYLVALPILVLARPGTLASLARIGREFLDGGFIVEADRPRYDALMASTRRLLCSGWVGLGLVLAAYAVTLATSGILYPATASTWAAPVVGATGSLSLAGWWRLAVSQPLFNLLVLVWLWRVALWARFVWTVSRLDLRLVPAHPDLTGGLQFVATSIRAFVPVTFALSAAIAGGVAALVVYGGADPTDYKVVIGVVVAVALVLFVGPLLPLTFPLRRAKGRGIFRYGHIAALLGRRFEARWTEPTSAIGDDALAAPDFSAVGELFSVASNVRQMAIYPIGIRALAPIVIAAVAPFLPLVFFIGGVEEAFRFAGGFLL